MSSGQGAAASVVSSFGVTGAAEVRPRGLGLWLALYLRAARPPCTGSHSRAAVLLLLWELQCQEEGPRPQPALDGLMAPGRGSRELLGVGDDGGAPASRLLLKRVGSLFLQRSAPFPRWATEGVSGTWQNLGALLAAEKPRHHGQSWAELPDESQGLVLNVSAERDETRADGDCVLGWRGDGGGKDAGTPPGSATPPRPSAAPVVTGCC